MSSSTADLVVAAAGLRLRREPSLDTFAPVLVPPGTAVEVSLHPPWARMRARVAGEERTGWCLARMLQAATRTDAGTFPAAERRMWELVEQHTGRVAYARGVKAEGLDAVPPVIDCSGWVPLLLTSAMTAENAVPGEDVFDADALAACQGWSDRILLQIEARTPALLDGRSITASTLPRCATIGVDRGPAAWTANHPRLRGINHIVQVVRRPADEAAFVSESIGPPPGEQGGGVRLTPLSEWLAHNARFLEAGKAWAVDPFAMARSAR